MFHKSTFLKKAACMAAIVFISGSVTLGQVRGGYQAPGTGALTTVIGPNSDPASVSFSGNGGSACIPSASAGVAYTVAVNAGTGYTNYTYQWSVSGKATLVSSSGATATVKPVFVADIDYAPGVLNVVWSANKDTTVTVSTCNSTPVTYTYKLLKSGSASATLYQKFNTSNLIKIVGPTCVSPNENVTFSIKPVVSAGNGPQDGYKWNYVSSTSNLNPTAGQLLDYESPDKSSTTVQMKTVTPPATLSYPFSLKVNIGVCNQAVADEKTLVFGQKMAKPVAALNGSIVASFKKAPCLPLTTAGGQVALSVPSPDNTNINYLWSTDIAGYTIVSGAMNTNAVTLNIGTGVGKIYLTASPKTTAFCTINNQPLYDTITITRSLTGASIVSTPIAGNACLGQGDVQAYTLSPNPGINVNWSMTAAPTTGWSLSPANPTTGTVNVTVGAGALPKTLNVVAVGCAGTITLPLSTKAGNLTGTLGGPTCVASGDMGLKTYTIPTAATLAIGYQWTLPTGWTAPAPATLVSPGVYNTTTLSINVLPNGTSVGTLSVVPRGNCANGAGLSLPISFSAIAASNINFVAPKTSINANGAGTTLANYPIADNFNLEVANPVAGQTYTWSMNPASPNFVLNGTAPVTGTSASFTTNGVVGTYTVKVDATSGACAGTPATFSKVFTVVANTARMDSSYDDVTGMYRFVVRDNSTNAFYATGTCYTWYKNGVQIRTGCAAADRVLNLGDGASALTNVSVDVTPVGATSATRLTRTTRNANQLRQALEEDLNTTEAASLSISPNPTSAEFTMALAGMAGADVRIIEQATGKEVKRFTASSNVINVPTATWAAGVYVVTATAGANRLVKTVVISH